MSHPTVEMDNTTPLRKKDLQDPTVVQAVQSMGEDTDDVGTSHPQENPDQVAKEVQEANRPAPGEESGRAGGKSAAADGGDGGKSTGGPGHGQLPGGAKGTSGAGATAGGPFQSESGNTLETGKDYQKPDPAT